MNTLKHYWETHVDGTVWIIANSIVSLSTSHLELTTPGRGSG